MPLLLSLRYSRLQLNTMANENDQQSGPKHVVRIPARMKADFHEYLRIKREGEIALEPGELFAAALLAFWECSTQEQDRLLQEKYVYWRKKHGSPADKIRKPNPNGASIRSFGTG